MSTEVKNNHIFARQPLATTGKLTIAGLLGCAAGSVGLSILAGEPITPLLIIATCLVIGAGIVATHLRWTPLLGVINAATTPFEEYLLLLLTLIMPPLHLSG